MIQGNISGPRIPASLDKLCINFHENIVRAVQIEIKNAERISKQERLSGPRPDIIAPVTGALRASVTSKVEDTPKQVKAILSAGPLRYARILEEGGYAGRGRKTFIRARSYIKFSLKAITPYLKARLSKLTKGT